MNKHVWYRKIEFIGNREIQDTFYCENKSLVLCIDLIKMSGLQVD